MKTGLGFSFFFSIISLLTLNTILVAQEQWKVKKIEGITSNIGKVLLFMGLKVGVIPILARAYIIQSETQVPYRWT